MTAIKVGDKFVARGGDGAIATVLLVTKVSDTTHVTYKVSPANRPGWVVTLGKASFLDMYERPSIFFEAGKAYRLAGMDGTYYVQETYRISNPVNEGHRHAARVIGINSNGKRWMTTLTGWEFKFSTEVEK